MFILLNNLFTFSGHPTSEDLGVTSEPPEQFPQHKAHLVKVNADHESEEEDEDYEEPSKVRPPFISALFFML